MSATYKIGIFGDSFSNLRAKNQDYLQWWEYAHQQMHGTEITNHGVAGSSLYYTWRKFHEHQHKYDKIILCGTESSRLWLPHLPKEWNCEHIHGMHHFDPNFVNNPPVETDDVKMIRDALQVYFEYIVNDQEARDRAKLQVDDMRRKRPDLLYLPCFDASDGPNDYIPLITISELDGRAAMRHDKRANHLNDTNNRILGDKIVKWLSTNEFNMEIKDFSTK
jgi:hypothetical protein|tara:strand:+ start:640 stop:1302 length:663 start_codon:yes stop_codon:yes gene_type:complete